MLPPESNHAIALQTAGSNELEPLFSDHLPLIISMFTLIVNNRKN